MTRGLRRLPPRETKNALAQLLDGHGRLSSLRDLSVLLVGAVAGLGTFAAAAGFTVAVPLPYQITASLLAGAGAMSLVNQFIRFFRRNREGYAWGLAFDALWVGQDPRDGARALQLGVVLRNTTAGLPIEYHVERFDAVLGSQTIANPEFDSSGGIIYNGGTKEFRFPSFSPEVAAALVGKTSEGSMALDIAYGKPGQPFVRRLELRLRIFVNFFPGSISGAAAPLTESDEPI